MARPGFRIHPKLMRLAYMLGLPIPYAWGLCECLWDCAYQKGNPFLGESIDVELAAQYPGEPGTLTAALHAVRLIDEIETGKFQVHDLLENAPDFVRKRFERDQERKHKYSPRQRTKTDQNGIRRTNSGISPPNSDQFGLNGELGRTHSTAQHSTGIDDAGASSCSESASPAPEPKALPLPSIESTAVLTFPTIGPGAKEWHLTEEKLSEYRQSFPAVDVLAECRIALQWCRDNPKKRKTANGMAKFLTGWLTRAQNSGRPAQTASPATLTDDEQKRRSAEQLDTISHAREAALQLANRKNCSDKSGSESLTDAQSP